MLQKEETQDESKGLGTPQISRPGSNINKQR